MGFFSRKSTGHSPVLSREGGDTMGLANPTSPVAVIKSKWYKKGKALPDVPKEDLSMNGEGRDYRRNASIENDSHSRAATDPITKTMAERLNELIKSHAEGMIDDETYRDLRASLFERFGAASHPSVEPSHVRISNDPSSSSAASSSNGTKRHSIVRPDSNFHLAPRPPSMNFSRPHTPGGSRSIRSTTSRTSTVATAVTGLLRRGTKKRPSENQQLDSRPGSPDNVSMFSATSSTAGYSRAGGYQGSTPSLASVGGARAPSLSSRRTGRSGLTSRSFATPPSSYHRHGHAYGYGTGVDTEVRSKTESEVSMSADLSEYDDKSPSELREAMVRTEREGRKMLDAFNGLELTVLTKYRGAGGAMGMAGVGGVSGTGTGWTHVSHPSDGGGYGTDYGYGTERRSNSTRRRIGQIRGKGSSSSPSLHSSPLHPNKGRSLSLSGTGSISGGSVRSRSPQPPTVHEEASAGGSGMDLDDPDMSQLHQEMEDIRRRRAQVAQRYETRLEMLRVKLKSAELRDKVAR
ncbi:hypothetical protein CTheo_698 [Ceratobasidium theobromae]|uniref:Uncharacterized protein n=1 Tax=Ceratobasidium theobromae TaxID=1582974 RepID=A0A5N5QW64_9AGAM|nr:hypothetical protein CTheo_698 [Ceratobasidium theobromae]